MQELDLVVFYEKVLGKVLPPKRAIVILDLVCKGTESIQTLTQVLEQDYVLKNFILTNANRLDLKEKVTSIPHALSLLGLVKCRNALLGYSLWLHIESIKNPPVAVIRSEEPPLENEQDLAIDDESKDNDDNDNDAKDSKVPQLEDFLHFTNFAITTEMFSNRIQAPKPEICFAAGYIFDVLDGIMKVSSFQTDELKFWSKPHKRLRLNWYLGMQCALASQAILNQITLTQARHLFAASLLHNIGQIILFIQAPKQYDEVFSRLDDPNKVLMEEESLEFSMNHTSIGSLYLANTQYLANLEKVVDYHHHTEYLKFFDNKLYSLTSLVQLASSIVYDFQFLGIKNEKIWSELRYKVAPEGFPAHKHPTQQRAFSMVKFSVEEWKEIKSFYIQNIRHLPKEV